MIKIDNAQEFALLRLDGALDLADATSLEEALANLDSEPVIIVSLEAVDFLDSTILSVLLRADARNSANFVLVVAPESDAERIFHTSGLRDRLRFASTLDQAISMSRMLRDIAAASFSRDGVALPPTKIET